MIFEDSREVMEKEKAEPEDKTQPFIKEAESLKEVRLIVN